ncbi:MAG: hypothetical protein SV062_03430 [Thermodesulfobacteriota bacterium]|nr:hypothetical protein [Thermodesulfobacteriota bacterium]
MIQISIMVFRFFCYFYVILIFLPVEISMAAMGCTLRNPDRDIRRFFPSYTGYKTSFLTIWEIGGVQLFKEIEQKLGDRFEPVYETIDVPYACYTIFQKKEIMGYMHGVNQKGEFGGMQLILATDGKGKILNFYYQSLTGPDRKLFKDKKFTELFKGLTMSDFYLYDPVKGKATDIKNPLTRIKNPGKRNDIDFKATLRGLKKNLIIFDILFSKKKQN